MYPPAAGGEPRFSGRRIKFSDIIPTHKKGIRLRRIKFTQIIYVSPEICKISGT